MKIRNILFVIVLILMTACHSLDSAGHRPGTAGFISSGESPYDKKKFAMLAPGSLFDEDNTPGVFKLGLIWDQRYGDDLKLIAAFPLGMTTSTSELSKNTDVLEVEVEGKKFTLPRVKDSIEIKESNAIIKEYGASIKYKITRQVIKLMLSSENVVFTLDAGNKVYKGHLHVPASERNYYRDVYYTAVSGMTRFYEKIWGNAKP